MRRTIRLAALLAAVVALAMTAIPAAAAFPGQNGTIVFSSNRGGTFEIYSMNPDGSGVTQLTTFPPCSRGPWASSDGSKIAFHGNLNADCSGLAFDIYTVNADGTGLMKLTNGGYNVTPAWSPDGTTVAFVSNQTVDGSCQIVTTSADGTGRIHQVTHINPPVGLGGLSWSADGSKLVYGTAVGTPQCPGPTGTAANLQIHVINANGGNDTVLETESFIPGISFNTSRHPDWSPDGSQITYASTRSGDLQVWTMNADGTNQVQVTHDPNTPENFSRFSPDGSQLVFQAQPASLQGVEIRVVNVDGSHEVKVIDGKFRNIQPSWSPS
jgi:TolB protein